MAGQLNKLRIEAFPTIECQTADLFGAFEAMFNPSTYQQKHELEYEEEQGQGTTGTPQKFSKIKPQEFTLEFVLDGTGASSDKPDEPEKGIAPLIEDFLELTAEMDGDTHRPRFLKIVWGNLVRRCVLKTANITYTLFLPNGFPLRAKISASFLEVKPDDLRVAEEGKNSPDLTHARTVREGDDLPAMTFGIYGDVQYYQDVARFNRLHRIDPLEPGSVLRFPPLERLLAHEDSTGRHA